MLADFRPRRFDAPFRWPIMSTMRISALAPLLYAGVSLCVAAKPDARVLSGSSIAQGHCVVLQTHAQPLEMPVVDVQGTRIFINHWYHPRRCVPAPPPRMSIFPALQLAFEMDAQRERRRISQLFDESPDRGFDVLMREGMSTDYYLRRKWLLKQPFRTVPVLDIRTNGWDDALDRVPGVVVR
jgi:hypothetical protein